MVHTKTNGLIVARISIRRRGGYYGRDYRQKQGKSKKVKGDNQKPRPNSTLRRCLSEEKL